MKKRALNNLLAAAFLFLLGLIFVPQILSAATLSFSPSSGVFHIGQTISANVVVSSTDKVMNAASGVVTFPKDLLEATSISKSGSIISLWAEEPAFSNANGTVNFEGVILNPGFNGSAGKIITIYFKVKAIGNAVLNFSSASVLANDGRGTNILNSSGTGSYKIEKGDPSVPKQTDVRKPSSVIIVTPTSTQSTITATSATIVIISAPTESATTTVFRSFMDEVMSLLSLIVPLVAMIVLLILLLYYALQKYKSLKNRTLKEALEAEIVLGRSFTLLKDSVRAHISKLESLKTQGALNSEEDRFLEQLKSDLHSIEASVKKEIKDIENLQ